MDGIINSVIDKLGANQVFVSFLIFGVLYGIYKIVIKYPKIVDWLLLRYSKRAFDKPNLKHHVLFTSLDSVQNEIKYEEFEYPQKTKMFIDFMAQKITRVRDKTLEFLDEEDIETCDKAYLLKRIMKLLQVDIVEGYISETERMFMTNGLTHNEAKDIIEIFEDWRKPVVNAMLSNIKSAFTNPIYIDNYFLIHATLMAMNMGVLLIPQSGVESFKQMNGRFAKVNYKGTKVL